MTSTSDPASIGEPPPETVTEEDDRPLGLRRGLRRVSAGLIAYGVVGLGLAVIGAIALLWVGGRVGGLSERTSDQVESIIATLDRTAAVLDDAGLSASSFAVTLERTPPALLQTAQTVANLRTNLQSVEGQLAAINILGSRPLAEAARLFGQMAGDLEGLDARLTVIATDLGTNRAALLANAGSLQDMGARIGVLADGLRGGIIEDSFADVQVILTVLFVLLVVWTALPAAGALALGWWLRGQVGPRGD